MISQVSSRPMAGPCAASVSAEGGAPPSTPRMKLYWSGRLQRAHLDERLGVGDVAEVEALQLRLHPALPHRLRRQQDVPNGLGKTMSKTNAFRFSEYFA